MLFLNINILKKLEEKPREVKILQVLAHGQIKLSELCCAKDRKGTEETQGTQGTQGTAEMQGTQGNQTN